MEGLLLPVCSIVFSVLLGVVFFIKKRISLFENKVYGVMLIASIIDSILVSVIQAIAIINGSNTSNLMLNLVNKLDFATLIVFSNCIFLYTLLITIKESREKINYIINGIIITDVIAYIFIIINNIQLISEGSNYSITGIPVIITYILCGLYLLSAILITVLNINKITKRHVPTLSIIIIALVLFIIFRINPYLVVISITLTFINYIMFFTIENPDVKIIKQLEVAKNQADKANAAKTDFLSSMSHEIRTPLNAIVGFSDCIATSETLDEAKENARDIINASTTLLEIVNGILDISKIEAGKIEIVNAPYNARQTFEDLAKLITPRMREKGLEFTYYIAQDIPVSLIGDHGNIRKIITNLLSNACKYTEKGFVRYEVNCVNSNNVTRLIITVEDSGQGVKKENIDKLFTKFQRLEEDKNATIEGTGLGLAITKQLIELMGGRIIVHTVYGKGSKFTVVIDQQIDTAPVTEYVQHQIKDSLDLNNVKILLVDDNELNRKVGIKVLKQFNANQITTAESGFECIDKIKNNEKYDIILLDDMMPKMRGEETLAELKKISGFNIPVIALTANAITGMREHYIEKGFNDYLSKPLEKDQLVKVLNKIMDEYNIVKNTEYEQSPVTTNTVQQPLQNTIINNTEFQEQNGQNSIPSQQLVRNMESLDANFTTNQQSVNTVQNTNVNIISTNQSTDNIGSIDALSTVPTNKIETLDANKQDNFEQLNYNNSSINIVPPKEDSTQIEGLMEQFTQPSQQEETDGKKAYLKNNGVDLDKALELLGDMEMYNDTVDSFLEEVEEKWKNIENYKLTGNMKDYAIEVHSLKSDAKYLGFTKLADIAYQHELASKENNIEFVNTNFNQLVEEYQKTLAIIKQYKNMN